MAVERGAPVAPFTLPPATAALMDRAAPSTAADASKTAKDTPVARYIVRIQTPDASPDVVRGMEAAMRRAGFTRAIQGANGRVFHLPSETYVGDVVEADTVLVKNAVVKLARRLVPQAWVLVTQGPSAWQTEETSPDRGREGLS